MILLTRFYGRLLPVLVLALGVALVTGGLLADAPLTIDEGGDDATFEPGGRHFQATPTALAVKPPASPPAARPAASATDPLAAPDPLASPAGLSSPDPEASPAALSSPHTVASPSALSSPHPVASPSALSSPHPVASPSALSSPHPVASPGRTADPSPTSGGSAPSATAAPTPSTGGQSTPRPRGRERATRIVVPSLGIDLPIVPGDLVVQGNRNFYPLCDVAQYMMEFSQPGEGGTTYIYAHARRGMFLPLLRQSRRNNGRAMIGALVEVYTSHNRLHRYEIYRVKRHATDLSIIDELPRAGHQVVMQTSEGPRGTVPKLQVAAKPIDVVQASRADANPSAKPRACR